MTTSFKLIKRIEKLIINRERLFVAIILFLYIIIAVLFSLGPIFEGPDEIEHVRYVRTLAANRALPDPLSRMYSEYHQAPLYYLLASPIAALITMSDFDQIEARRNPYGPFEIDSQGNDNKNQYLHSSAEAFPYQGSPTALATHLMRLLSIALGVCTVLASYGIFRLLWPNRADLRLLALAILAFWPQFLYGASTVSNDNTLNLFSTLTLLMLLDQHKHGMSWKRSVLLGVISGCALLSKVSAAFLIFPIATALLLQLIRVFRLTDPQSRRSALVRYAGFVVVMTLCVLAVCGWWFVHNLIAYHDVTLVSTMFTKVWPTEMIGHGEIALDIGLSRVGWTYNTLWASFGGGRIWVHPLMYTGFTILVLLSLIGTMIKLGKTIRHMARQPNIDGLSSMDDRWQLTGTGLIVGVFIVAWLLALLYYVSTAWSGNQGRYLLPAIAVWAAIGAYGLAFFFRQSWRIPATVILCGGLAVTALISVIIYFLPAYNPLPVPTTIDHPLAYRFGDSAELIGVSPVPAKATPGETIKITLYWRALRPVTPPVGMYLHSVESDLVRRNSMPATGNLLSSDWRADQTWAESYTVPIPESATSQTTYTLVAGLFGLDDKAPLQATDANGSPVIPVIGRLAINSESHTGNSQPDQHFTYRFGDQIGLEIRSLTRSNETVQACFVWTSLRPVDADYRLFVHLFDAKGELLDQISRQPKEGQYPTSVWVAGESITDCFAVDIHKLVGGKGHFEIGLFHPVTVERLPIWTQDMPILPNGLIKLPLN